MKSLNLNLLFVLLLFSCGEEDDTNEPLLLGTETRSMVGRWALDYPNITGLCNETLTVNDDFTWQKDNNEKIMTGTYSFEGTISSGDRHLFSIQVGTDNELADCGEETYNNVGLIINHYLLFESDTLARAFQTPRGQNFNDPVDGNLVYRKLN